MALPFARPPGRRKALDRFGPEVSAGAAYFVLIVVAWLAREESHPFVIGAAFAYGTAALFLTIGPISSAVATLADEHARGTMEALVLTPLDHAELAWGRYWHAVWPWLRLILWLAPVYLMAANSPMLADAAREHLLPAFVSLALGPKPAFIAMIASGTSRDAAADPGAALVVPVRAAGDGLTLMAVVAVGFLVAARARRHGPATFWGYAAALLALLTVFSAAEWLVAGAVLVASVLNPNGFRPPWGLLEAVPWIYCLGLLAVVGVKLLAVRLCVGWVARNFDYWALGEKPGRAIPPGKWPDH